MTPFTVKKIKILSFSNILPDTKDHLLSTNEVTLLTKEISQIKNIMISFTKIKQ